MAVTERTDEQEPLCAVIAYDDAKSYASALRALDYLETNADFGIVRLVPCRLGEFDLPELISRVTEEIPGTDLVIVSVTAPLVLPESLEAVRKSGGTLRAADPCRQVARSTCGAEPSSGQPSLDTGQLLRAGVQICAQHVADRSTLLVALLDSAEATDPRGSNRFRFLMQVAEETGFALLAPMPPFSRRTPANQSSNHGFRS